MTARSLLHNSVMALLFAGLLAGCTEGPASPSSEDSLSVPEVSVVELQPAPLAVIRELPGRIAPTRIAEVRARVSGIVVNRNFEQGSDVKAGDVLYELDARPFEIDVDAAEAAFRKATAVLTQEKKNAKRMEMLAPSGAAAQSQLESPSPMSARPRQTSPHARPTSRGPSSIWNIPASARRSAAASAVRSSPKARWLVKTRRRMWPRFSSSI